MSKNLKGRIYENGGGLYVNSIKLTQIIFHNTIEVYYKYSNLFFVLLI